jgi:hypothetical protein
MPNRPRRTPLSTYLARVVVVLAAALALAACGASSSSLSGGTGTVATGNASPIAMSKCFRAHGLTNFPDPNAGPGGEGFNGVGISNNGTLVVDGITFSGPVAKAAMVACKRFLPGGGGPPPQLSAAQKKKILAQAECMRTHGVPNFPDPNFSGGGVGIKIANGSAINPQSPAFQAAAKACGGVGFRFHVNARGA